MQEKTKFRKFITSTGKLLLAGKNAEQNEDIIKQVASNEIVLHTEAAGSPFVNIKGSADKKDIQEAAIFCAKYSRDWKKNKRDIEVHYFYSKDVYKDKSMKIGTFGVKNFKKIIVKKKDIEKQMETKNESD